MFSIPPGPNLADGNTGPKRGSGKRRSPTKNPLPLGEDGSRSEPGDGCDIRLHVDAKPAVGPHPGPLPEGEGEGKTQAAPAGAELTGNSGPLPEGEGGCETTQTIE